MTVLILNANWLDFFTLTGSLAPSEIAPILAPAILNFILDKCL